MKISTQPKRLVRPKARKEQGVALIEVLAAMLMIALWLLSNAGLQLSSLKYQKSAQFRLTAVSLASELSERMETNKRGMRASNYALGSTDTQTTASIDCSINNCTPLQIAQFDLAAWSKRVTESLPGANMTVADISVVGGLTVYTITITWLESRGRQTYDTAGQTETVRYVVNKTIA